uniref:uncharacterized protein isoform X2 n=1 Tax=Myxine glutinosa TaxID=7769 RepID=UPI00358FD47A
MAEVGQKIIVMDNGSGITKVGFAGDNKPSAVFPGVVGHPFRKGVMLGARNQDEYVGYEAQRRRSVLSLKHPIERGVVTCWEGLRLLWHHCFYTVLRAAPEEHKLLITEVPFNPPNNRERMAEILFEEFEVPTLCITIPAHLALFASGPTSGLVVDSGDSVTHAVAVCGGRVESPTIFRMNVGGQDLSERLGSLVLARHGRSLVGTASERSALCAMKERLCFVSRDLASDKMAGAALEHSHEMPDGTYINIGVERFMCPEALFQPGVLGPSSPSLQQAIVTCIEKSDTQMQETLYNNIILAGGNTLFPGLAERLKLEVARIAPQQYSVKVLAPAERKYAAWLGGSVFACLPMFPKACVTRSRYDECGPRIMHHTSMELPANLRRMTG